MEKRLKLDSRIGLEMLLIVTRENADLKWSLSPVMVDSWKVETNLMLENRVTGMMSALLGTLRPLSKNPEQLRARLNSQFIGIDIDDRQIDE